MASLVGGPLSGAPQSSNGPGPHECQFASDTSTRECPGSIEISYFPRGSGQTAKEWIDGNENGYHPQPESGLGDYAVFDATLKETSAAKGPIAIVVAASCGGSTTAQVESLQAQAVTAAFTKLPS